MNNQTSTQDAILISDHSSGPYGYRVITLNRPDFFNAITDEMIETLNTVLVQTEATPKIRAIIIASSSDKSFCSGADLRDFYHADLAKLKIHCRGFARLFIAMRKSRLLIVSAVNGFAVGGGMGLVLNSDFILATKTARFGTPEIKRGVFPYIIGYLLRRSLPEKCVNEMVYAGQLFSSGQLNAYGIFSAIRDTREEVQREAVYLVEKLLSSSIDEIAQGKMVSAQADQESFAKSLYAYAEALAINLDKTEVRAHLRAFLKR